MALPSLSSPSVSKSRWLRCFENHLDVWHHSVQLLIPFPGQVYLAAGLFWSQHIWFLSRLYLPPTICLHIPMLSFSTLYSFAPSFYGRMPVKHRGWKWQIWQYVIWVFFFPFQKCPCSPYDLIDAENCLSSVWNWCSHWFSFWEKHFKCSHYWSHLFFN